MKNENARYILTLTTICLVAASLLTGVYFLTNPRILQQKAQQEKQALTEVFPRAGYFEPVTKDGQVTHFKAYTSLDKKRLLGYAFRAEAQGYASVIETMAGVDTKGVITGITVLAQNETPGLGAQIEQVLVNKTLWQKIKELFAGEKTPQDPIQPWFCAQFTGKEIKDLIVVRSPGAKNIQAITGATISSRALTVSVREKAKQVLEHER
ncbi:MAG: FMN-binding protein [Candidatus Omnitrophica bacterium]|nr:FMN-binding protein [Candidatus Omnitrophota bacterium]